MRTIGPVEPLDEPRRDDPDHALVPVLVPEDVPTPSPLRLGQRVHGRDRVAQDPLLDRLAIAIQLLEDVGATPCLVRIGRQHELERHVGTTQPAGSVDPGREAEADGAGVDGCRIHVRAPHERLQPRTRGRGRASQPGRRQRAVLVDERHDVGDRRERDEIEIPSNRGVVGAEERLAELVHDARSTQLGERIARGARRDDRAVGKHVSGSVVVGDDDLEAASLRLGDLLHRCDPAVDGEDETHAVLGESLEGLRARRRIPLRTGSADASVTSAPSSRSTSTARAVAQIPSTS